VSLTLADAVPDDIPAILAMIGELADFERLSHEVVATEASLHEALFGAQPVATTVLARFDGEVAGFALYFTSFSTFLSRAGVYIEDLYVRPVYRGRGVGKALLVHVARRAVGRGCGRMEWAVLNWNRRAAEFYEALGARPVDGWTAYRLDRASLEALTAASGEAV
jgi:GNAT superfamily N-acetyltransferase